MPITILLKTIEMLNVINEYVIKENILKNREICLILIHTDQEIYIVY
jgi:hypothetical protein